MSNISVSQHRAIDEHPSISAMVSAVLLQPTPTADLLQLWNLGVAGVPLPQYLRWADDVGLFVAMADSAVMSVDDILGQTALSARGADALLGILCSLHLAHHDGNGYRLSATAREYLDRRSPYYVGPSLYGVFKDRLPARMQKGEQARRYSKTTSSLLYWLRYLTKVTKWGRRSERLEMQHSRNFPAAVVASRSKHFAGLSHIIDIGGGTGALAIPLAAQQPNLRITLVDLQRVLPNTEEFLNRYSVHNRIKLMSFNVHHMPWPFPACDGFLFGNFMHFCADDECLALLNESYRLLPAGGRVILHEMLWNDTKDGPLVTALWNFWLISVSAGRQRTKAEFTDLCTRTGFPEPIVEETCGGFSLLVCIKPAV